MFRARSLGFSFPEETNTSRCPSAGTQCAKEPRTRFYGRVSASISSRRRGCAKNLARSLLLVARQFGLKREAYRVPGIGDATCPAGSRKLARDAVCGCADLGRKPWAAPWQTARCQVIRAFPPRVFVVGAYLAAR
ncbi:hypothetical protein MTO96_013216 [Rhipicephalus appendiculatus]